MIDSVRILIAAMNVESSLERDAPKCRHRDGALLRSRRPPRVCCRPSTRDRHSLSNPRENQPTKHDERWRNLPFVVGFEFRIFYDMKLIYDDCVLG